MFRFFKICFIFGVLSTVFVSISIYYFIQPPGSSQDKCLFEIPKGAGAAKICLLLQEKNLIRSQFLARIYLKITGLEKNLPSGVFQLHQGFNVSDLFRQFQVKKRDEVTVTIPEGLKMDEALGLITQKLNSLDKEEITRLSQNYPLKHFAFLSDDNYCLEGMIFPETYRFYVDSTSNEIFEKILTEFQSRIDSVMKQQNTLLTGEVFLEKLTLASIVEKEARKMEEMPRIASVFINRLKKKMALESCATVQFALKQRKSRLTYEDIKIDSPYNTYLINGLPPGPICSPSEKAFSAVLSAETTDYLYFVHKGDGTHIFTSSLKEHNRAKRKVMRKKR